MTLRISRLTWVHFTCWLVLFALLWALLSGARGWGFGVICSLLASAVCIHLNLSPPYFRPLALLKLLRFFVWEMWLGGWDVARRVLHPRLPTAPAWVRYPLQSRHPGVRLLLSAMVGLMPGTLASRIDQDDLHLHVLDQHLPWQRTVAHLESLLDQTAGEKR